MINVVLHWQVVVVLPPGTEKNPEGQPVKNSPCLQEIHIINNGKNAQGGAVLHRVLNLKSQEWSQLSVSPSANRWQSHKYLTVVMS